MSKPIRMTRRAICQSFVISSGAALLYESTPAALADDVAYPAKPVRIVVPYGPGGIADVTMRVLADALSQKLGQKFFIDNRPGAGGIIGMQETLRAPVDGYTLTMIGGGLTIAKALFRHLPYDIETDVEPISTTASYGLVVATKAGSPLKSIKNVVAAAKAHPGTLNIGTINAGSTQNLSAELFRIRSGIDVTIIPFKTTPELANAVLRGDIQVAFEYFAGLEAFIQSKQMTVIATTGHSRSKNLPDIPTMMESGVSNYDVTSWNGLGVRVGTSPAIVNRLHDLIVAALETPNVQKLSNTAGMDAHGETPDALRARIKEDVAKWTEVIQKAGIKRR